MVAVPVPLVPPVFVAINRNVSPESLLVSFTIAVRTSNFPLPFKATFPPV
jgi:hypothetical protein